MLTGIRLAIGISWIVLVPAEMLGVNAGLGYYILDARDRLAYSELMAVVLVVGALGSSSTWRHANWPVRSVSAPPAGGWREREETNTKVDRYLRSIEAFHASLYRAVRQMVLSRPIRLDTQWIAAKDVGAPHSIQEMLR